MKKDIFWNSIGTAAWSFLSLALLVIVTRVNGLDDSGAFSFAFAFALIMYTVACYGGRTYQVSDHGGSFSTNNYISLRLYSSIAVIVITIMFIALNNYEWYKAALILILVGHRIFDAIADVFYGVLQKNNHLYVAGRSLFLKSLTSFAAFTIIDLVTGNLLLASLSLPVVGLLFLLIYDIPQGHKVETFSISLRSNGIKEILTLTFLPFSTIVLGLIFANIARYFIDIYHPSMQGYFGIIVMPLSLTLLIFSFILTPAILPMSKALDSKKIANLHKMVLKIVTLTAGGTLLLCLLAYLFGAPLLGILFNIEFSNYVLDMTFVIAIGFTLSLASLFTNIAIIARKLRVTTLIHLLTTLLLALLCLLFVNQLEIRGAIIAYAIASSIQAGSLGVYYLLLVRDSIRESKKL